MSALKQPGAKLRISAVSFLNARPITYGLEQALGQAGDRFDLSFDLPSRCAERLAEGDADLGLIPVGAYAASAEELRIVPGIAIASHGAVRTVLLVGEVPWEEMTEIALDGASRSSAMLLKLLCHERGLAPQFREVAHEEVLAAAHGTTGALVIGDAGFAAGGRFAHVQDLGAAWLALTGLPFVYAVWAGRPGRRRRRGPSRPSRRASRTGSAPARSSPARTPRRTAAIRPRTSRTSRRTSAIAWAPRSSPGWRPSFRGPEPPGWSRERRGPASMKAPWRRRARPRAALVRDRSTLS